MLERGIRAIHSIRPSFPVSARSTVQRDNYFMPGETARTAWDLGLQSVSFLAADLTSVAFNRSQPWNSQQQSRVALDENEIPILEQEIQALAAEWSGSSFVLENPEKLRRIALHFRAHLNLSAPSRRAATLRGSPPSVEADGTVRPCFFHKPVGRVNGKSLIEVLNGFEAQQFRRTLDVATNPVCQRCVCSLHLSPHSLTKLLHNAND